MTLTLHLHPLSSYCQKALTALYENDTPFEKNSVDLAKPDQRAALVKLWTYGKFPVLVDSTRGETIAESTIVIEYLAQHYPGKSALIPENADLAREARFKDRVFDFYISDAVTKIVTDKFRPEGKHDPIGVEQATATIETTYKLVDGWMAKNTWAVGDTFSLADCAAAATLFFASRLVPFGANRNVASYLARLLERPSFARAHREAEPFMKLFPG